MDAELTRELRDLFARMEREYDRLAGEYEFTCAGCEDNCCSIGFQHHTLLEFELLRLGLETLPPEKRREIRDRAEAALREKAAGGNPRCPLLENGRCGLYEYRPMVCRLHGLPDVLRHPVQGEKTGDGCVRFQKLRVPPFPARLDRTPLYREFAGLEKRAREQAGLAERIPARSIPEMIVET